jgi:AcrR family transcriptional regulator
VVASTEQSDAVRDLPTIRPPQQQRSRETWARVLDAGVAILQTGGYEAFTIAAVCEGAQVAPRVIYSRADSKDVLFLAVYEHGIARVRADQAVFGDEGRWEGLSADQLARDAVREVAMIFTRHAAFLRPVVLLSAAHSEVNRRGAQYVGELGDIFAARLLRASTQIDHPDPEQAVRASFNTVFSTMALRVAYGPAFAFPGGDDDTLIDTMGTMVSRYLFRRPDASQR